MKILEINKLVKLFGGLAAVSKFHINRGDFVFLVGPSGAGKTTAFNLITGVYEPTSGEIIFAGENICGVKPFKINQKGMARTFQNIRLFKDLTVLDNVRIAYHSHVKYSVASAMLRFKSFFVEEKEIERKSIEFLKIFDLDSKKDELAKNLPYGEQRRLEIARALAAKPKLLLLDEPAAGMNPQETQDLMELIAMIREKFDLTILLIEHDMSLVMGVCERLYVLDHGMIIADGTTAEIRKNPKVIQAYLGEEAWYVKNR